MKRLAFVICVIAWMACGESDPAQTGAAGGTPVGTAAREAAGTPPVAAAPPKMAGIPEAPEAPAAADPKVQSCLDLIRQSKFEAALPVCLAALDVDPDNAEVRDAVATARAEAAKLAAAQAADQAGAETAAGAAASKLGEMTGGVAEKPAP